MFNFFKKKQQESKIDKFYREVNSLIHDGFKFIDYKLHLTDAEAVFGKYYEFPLLDFHDDSGNTTRTVKDRCEKEPLVLDPFSYNYRFVRDALNDDDPNRVTEKLNESIKEFLNGVKSFCEEIESNTSYGYRMAWCTRNNDFVFDLFEMIRPVDVDPFCEWLKGKNAPFVKEFHDYMIKELSDMAFNRALVTSKTGEKRIVNVDFCVQFDQPSIQLKTYGKWLKEHQEQLDRDLRNQSVKEVLEEIKTAMANKLESMKKEG